MNKRLEGKNVLVTGASSGIGAAISKAFAFEGAKVCVGFNGNEQAAESHVRSIQHAGGAAFAVRLPLDDHSLLAEGFSSLLRAFSGRLDVAVNNAGKWMDRRPLADCSDEIWDEMIGVNLTGLFRICRLQATQMILQRSGSIINITSIVGRTGGAGGTIPYAAAKGGANALTRGLAKELAAYGIRVNAIAPGIVTTPMMVGHAQPGQMEAWMKSVPLQRPARPEEICGPALLLASDEGSYITGETIEVNGGALMD